MFVYSRNNNSHQTPPIKPVFVESKLSILPTSTNPIPRLAYLISGVVKALYHPLNQYVLHLDLEASLSERLILVTFVENEDIFSKIDMLHTLASMPRNLNFLENTSEVGWKEEQRSRPVIINPGLYSLQKSDVFWVSEKRSLPTTFKLFTEMFLTCMICGNSSWSCSSWIMLSRPLMEYCYFHPVIYNTEEFRNTRVYHDQKNSEFRNT
ncbi:hypothetical protein MKX03_019870 [Papaver bracteatum]|nr:hypothetical protein MKX03_019870 [Papaver bracteatum]